MGIRLLLLGGLALIAYYVFLRRRTVPIHIALVLGMLAVAAALVVVPDVTTDLAHLLGVGRGVDLVTYVVEVSLFFVVVHYYSKFVELQGQLTTVVRELAILRAELEAARRADGKQV